MKKINGKTELFGLFGYPAKHSLSPFIHNHFFNKYDINSVYLCFEIIPDDLEDAICGAKKMGFSGLNLTMPFKESVLDYIDVLDMDAKTIKSVNTIKFADNKTEGYNTDIEGFIKSLIDARFEIEGSKCLIIGAGGVAKSSVHALLKMNAEKIFLYDINIKKAHKLSSIYNGTFFNKIFVLDNLDSVSLAEINLIINCTPAGMNLAGKESNIDLLPLPEKWNLKNKLVFEMVYNPIYTMLVKKSIHDGAKIILGLDMLLNQAAFSFKIWEGFFPDLKYLKKFFKNGVK
ncbi:MAG: shikimate dehydrogenase [Actinomycetota bacterium]|nr:shikimate dehydrogenase [Actinomycetota bacterium]